MSIDIVLIIFQLSLLIAGIVLVFLISRALTLGRRFVSQVYRSRAFWFAGVMLSVLFWLLFTGLFYSSVKNVEGIAVELSLITILLVFVCADRTILVMLEMDFFHRNTLHWRRARVPAYVAIFAGAIFLIAQIPLTAAPTCSGCYAALLPGLPSWVSVFINPTTESIVTIELLLGSLVIFGYLFSVFLIGTRRISDMTLKRHLRWLGLSVLLLIVTIAGGYLESIFIGFDGDVVLSSFEILVMSYTFYRALMSLTVIGKLEVRAS